MDKELSKIEFEIISQDNPVIINIPASKQILGIELKQFHFDPGNGDSSSTNSNNYPLYIGIAVEGTRGRFNQFGHITERLKVLPKISNM